MRVLAVVVAVLLAGCFLLNERDLRARKRRLIAMPDFMTDDERELMAGASLDQANHLLASVHQRRLREFSEWLERHVADRGPFWQLQGPDGSVLEVEIRRLEDFDDYIPPRELSWSWRTSVQWHWDLEAPRVTAWSERWSRRQWVFQPVPQETNAL